MASTFEDAVRIFEGPVLESRDDAVTMAKSAPSHSVLLTVAS
jgi:hypothetical protein